MHDSDRSDESAGFTEFQTSGRIVANVAHELKTPLSAMTEGHKHIMVLLKEVRASLSKIPEVADKLLADLEEAECTLESTSNLSHFMKMSINRCIEYSHIKENHKLNPNLVSVNLADALRLPADCVSSIDPQHHLDVKPLPPHLCTHIIADTQWFQENLLSLLSNAVKYSNPESTIHTTLSLSLRTSLSLRKEFTLTAVSPAKVSPTVNVHTSPLCGEDRLMLLVECEDTGVGLSEEAMEQLFSPHKMAQRLAEGTGLGLLSLAKRMEALNGHCGVQGRRDGKQGCLFWFAMPYIPDELTADLLSSSKKNSLHAHPHAQRHQGQQGQNTPSQYTQQPDAQQQEAELPEHDVLSSTLKNVLPSPMLFETDDNADKFNTFAPFPVYAKRLSSRSLRSAMSNLPTTTSFSSAEALTPIGKWESDSSPSFDNNAIAEALLAVGSVGSASSVGRPLSSSTTGTLNMFSRSNSDNNAITPTATSTVTAGARSTKGRSLILSLPTEDPTRRGSFPSLEASTRSGFGCDYVSGAAMIGGPPLPPKTNTASNTNGTITNTATTNSATSLSAGTPPIPLPRTPPRAGGPQNRTVEPSPASSAGTPQRSTVDYGWTPDCISMIRTHIYTVLLVDDTPMILKMTSILLRRQGFDVTTAQNGAEAFALIQSRRFDVVLMDLQMPVLDGLEAARRIRALEKSTACTDPLFLIAVSANSDPMIVLETLSAGYDNYIEKPFTVGQFESVLTKYLAKKYY